MILRDPIHGDIYFSDDEKKIIDTPIFQRLRGIKQLGTTYFVYPGATHTRFDHSLGVGHLAREILNYLRIVDTEITKEEEQIVIISSLLHDIGHVPFGHTIEDERRIWEKHDSKDVFKEFLSSPILEDRLTRLGISDDVYKVLTESTVNSKKWMSQIVSNTISADFLDYIWRDGYYTGIRYNYDKRIFNYFRKIRGHLVVDLEKRGMVRYDARSEILNILRLRYFMTERVYYHHVKLSSGAMISKAVELAHNNNLIRREDMKLFNDQTLIDHLKSLKQKNYDGAPSELKNDLESIDSLVNNLENRNLLKRSYITSDMGRSKRETFSKKYTDACNVRLQDEREIVDQINRKIRNANMKQEEVIIYCLDHTNVLKEAEVLVKTKPGKEFHMLKKGNPMDVKTVEDAYENLWKLFVFTSPKYVNEVSKICTEMFQKENEYIPKKY